MQRENTETWLKREEKRPVKNPEWETAEILNWGVKDAKEGLNPANTREVELIAFPDQWVQDKMESEFCAWGNMNIVGKEQI